MGKVAERLKALLDQEGQLEVDIESLEIRHNHSHLFVVADPTIAPQQRANQFKVYTSQVLRQAFAHLRTRASVQEQRS